MGHMKNQRQAGFKNILTVHDDPRIINVIVRKLRLLNV
jgi:hypothetical protein